MLAMITDVSECSALSHHTGSTPKTPRKRLRMPESASIIHCHVVAETMIGSSHGTRNRPRSRFDSGKARRKNTARPSPKTYWKNSEQITKITVWPTIGQNCGEPMTSR